VVEDVVRLGPKLQRHTLADADILEQRYIPIVNAGSARDHGWRVADGAERRSRERSGVEVLIESALVFRKRRIAHHIRAPSITTASQVQAVGQIAGAQAGIRVAGGCTAAAVRAVAPEQRTAAHESRDAAELPIVEHLFELDCSITYWPAEWPTDSKL